MPTAPLLLTLALAASLAAPPTAAAPAAQDAAAEDAAADDAVAQADALIAEGAPAEAVERLDELGADPTANLEHALAYGRAYLAWVDQMAADGAGPEDLEFTLLDARSAYESALELSPADDSRARCALGYLQLYRLGDHTAAMQLADEGLAAADDDGELLLLRGCAGVYENWYAAQDGDAERAEASWSQAVADLQAAAERLPRERIEPWAQLAYLHEAKGDGVSAVRAAVEVADRQPEPDFDNLYRLGVKYSYERNWDASSLALQKIVNLSSLELTRRVRGEEQRDQVALELSWSVDPFVQRGDRATAINILRALVRADPKAPDLWHNYAVLCEETRDAEEAKAAYEKAIALAPDRPRPYNDLGSLLQRVLQTDTERAKQLYAKCIELATEQLQAEDLTDDVRDELTTARNLAQNSLDELVPKTPERALGGLLDGLLEGLGNAAGEAAGNEAEGESTTDGSGAQ